ncbi:hypothetical protein EVAR_22603_1 [Eumeta japonica]|uniref:Uncharacterized protein n=1 Tax=Eumeta variegata TaxID=151549 RepID=A0A4C1U884_EUMVA|nr:hypothetical protein EVAR_22603_1 [Eumeta japonica]
MVSSGLKVKQMVTGVSRHSATCNGFPRHPLREQLQVKTALMNRTTFNRTPTMTVTFLLRVRRRAANVQNVFLFIKKKKVSDDHGKPNTCEGRPRPRRDTAYRVTSAELDRKAFGALKRGRKEFPSVTVTVTRRH